MSPITRERWQRIEVILDTALVLPADSCKAYLDMACASDPELRQAVERFLAIDARLRLLAKIPAELRAGNGISAPNGDPTARRRRLADRVLFALDRDAEPASRVGLEAAVERLAALDDRLARVIKLRFLERLPATEAAAALDDSPDAVESDLRKASLLLYTVIRDES